MPFPPPVRGRGIMADGAGMPLYIGSIQDGARMANIFSMTGFSGSLSSLTNRNAAGGQNKSAKSQIMDQLAAADPAKAKKAEEKLSSMQQALEQMQQMRQDMNAARKEAAKQKVARIKAQIQAIKMMGGDAEANARKLARLARELSSAVRDYKAAGGTDGASGVSAAAGGASKSTEAADAAATATGASVVEGAEAAAPSSANAPTSNTSDTDNDDTSASSDDDDDEDSDAPAGSVKTASSEDADFAKEVRKLRRQIEAMLEKEKYRMALEEGKTGNRDTRAAEAALREVSRHATAIENPMPSINIQV